MVVNYIRLKNCICYRQSLAEVILGSGTNVGIASYQIRMGAGVRDKQYEYVFDDEIDFVDGEVIQLGDNNCEATVPAVGRIKSMDEFRKSLPVYVHRDEFLENVRNNQVVIVSAETGAGKTTQLPQYLMEAGYVSEALKIGCTQPRRVAAMSVAKRVSEERGGALGREVGYSVRFEDCTSSATRLKYMTDGMLLREFVLDPLLSKYSVVMIDEAHERTLSTDMLLGLIKDVARARKEFRIIVCSATLDANKFSHFFESAPIMYIPGRHFPVRIFYTKTPEPDYLDAVVATILQIHFSQPLPGDILVFLTGQDDIEAVCEVLSGWIGRMGTRMNELIVLPIYANLPADQQARIFMDCPANGRKCILATNIAETSLTIDGITYVIDPGFSKQKSYNPRNNMESLLVTPISQASSQQRAGRAGRVGPGMCFRLFTQSAFNTELDVNSIPEMQRSNLVSVILQMLAMGITDLPNFDFVDPPPKDTLIAALEMIYSLGAVNGNGELTQTGMHLQMFPLDPQMAKAIVVAASAQYSCAAQVLGICALLSTGSEVFSRPRDRKEQADAQKKYFQSPRGDHIMLLNIWEAFVDSEHSPAWCHQNYIQQRTMNKALDIYNQLAQICTRQGLKLQKSANIDNVCKALTAGFFHNVVRIDGADYRTIKSRLLVSIHPSSCLYAGPKHVPTTDSSTQHEPDKLIIPRWLMYHELVYTSKEYMRHVLQIDSAWLTELAPHYYSLKETADLSKRRLPVIKTPAK